MDPHGAVILDPAEGAVCPICCDSVLDDEELANPLCACLYQVCSFCTHRIQTEDDNKCPHCRTSYEPGPQAELAARRAALLEQRLKQEKLAKRQPTRRVATPPASPPARARPRGNSSNGGGVLEVPRRGGAGPAAKAAPPSPNRNLRLGQDSHWPGLVAGPSPRGRQQTPKAQAKAAKQQAARGAAAAAAPPPAASPPPQLPPLAVPSTAPETPPYGTAGGWGDRLSGSSAPTASGTPPSPVTAVPLRYYGNAEAPGGGPLSTAGECTVVLRGAGGGDGGMWADPEGAERVAALREAVRMGRVTPAAAAAEVVGRLLERRASLGAFLAAARPLQAAPPGFGGAGPLWEAPRQEAPGAGLFANWEPPAAPQFEGLGAPNGLPPSAVFPSSSLGLIMGGGGGEGAGARAPPPGFGAPAQELYGLAPGAPLG